jgi:aspartyl-tRNA(Asn)/glutamyl-tRNA(Gln) amidotransferase subunit C
MSISRTEVEHVARLAHLELSEDEKERMVRDLNRILDYVTCLEGVDIEGVDSVSPGNPETPLREDRISGCLDPGVATGVAPVADRDLFKVPPAIEGE